MLIYVDESGFQKNWVFVAVKIPSERDARLCIKRWRRYAASVSNKFVANEYRDSKTPDRQREKVLREISSMGFDFWALLIIEATSLITVRRFFNYLRRWNYPT